MQWFDLVNIILLGLVWITILFRLKIVYLERVYWLLFFLTFTVTELMAVYLSLKNENNLWLYNIGRPVQFVLLLAYFNKVLRIKKVESFAIILVGTLICLWFIKLGNKQAYGSLEVVVNGAIVSMFCIIYFHSLINSKNSIDLNLSEFWYCSSLFIFFGGGLCINGSMDFMIKYNLPLAQKLFYGLVANWYIFYALTIYALVSNYKFSKLD